MTQRVASIDDALEGAGLPTLERSAWVEVDLDALVANARALTAHAAPAALGAVVKADGYGHGLEMAARCAVAGGAGWLCVANAAEAMRLRRDGYGGRIFVLYPVPLAAISTIASAGVDVTVGSIEQAAAIAELVPSGSSLAVHLEVDTGMTRGGALPEDAVSAAREVIEAEGITLAGVWTHLAAPEDQAITDAQLDRFASVLERLDAAGVDPGSVHAAASGGFLAVDTAGHAFVRPGLAFYGVHPQAGDPLPPGVGPALAVRAHPVRIAEVPEGTSVGYAGTWTTPRPSVIATLPLGYADGWSRASSPGSSVLVEGGRAPIVGRISSDSLTVDVTDVNGVDNRSEFTLLGPAGNDAIAADDVAEVRGTISWEVLQQLGARLTRVYVSGGEPVAIRAESSISVTVAEGAAIPSY